MGWRQPASELGATTKSLLTAACKSLITDWLSAQDAFVRYPKMGDGRPRGEAATISQALYCCTEKGVPSARLSRYY